MCLFMSVTDSNISKTVALVESVSEKQQHFSKMKIYAMYQEDTVQKSYHSFRKNYHKLFIPLHIESNEIILY